MYSEELTAFHICKWLASSTAALINTEELFVRNVFLDLLTVTFVVEADDILAILLINSSVIEQTDENFWTVIERKNKTFETYWWPRVLVLIPVVFSMILIFLKHDIVNVSFPGKNDTCSVMILFSTLLIQVAIPYFVCLFDFIVSQWLNYNNDDSDDNENSNDESDEDSSQQLKAIERLKKKIVKATDHVPCVVYTSSLANLLPPIGALFYEKSAIAYFQMGLNVDHVNILFPLFSAIFVFIIEYFLKRLNSSDNQNGDNLSNDKNGDNLSNDQNGDSSSRKQNYDRLRSVLSIIMWFILLIYSPAVLIYVVVEQRALTFPILLL